MMEEQLSFFEESDKPTIGLDELFEAYCTCRSNKRFTAYALQFEVDYERFLIELWEEINHGAYLPGRSNAFIIHKPVKREIFAADFKDRVVHHLIFRKPNPLFEKAFIYDNYACRVGKGTHFGIKRLDQFIRRCSHNYSRDCYVLKLDIRGFFMQMDKHILFKELCRFVQTKYTSGDRELLLDLCKKIIYNEPAKNCRI